MGVEWEYACRAGAGTSRYYGASQDLLGRYAWYIITSQNHAGLCGSLLPNDLGLFDMLGNTWEWCHDEFHRIDTTGNTFDDLKIPLFVNESNPRVLRGGTFISLPAYVRSAGRDWYAPVVRGVSLGFRPSRTYP
jgi:formylglycine-generating enzyme required for sulfatase activity